jgi:hypothetical protein
MRYSLNENTDLPCNLEPGSNNVTIKIIQLRNDISDNFRVVTLKTNVCEECSEMPGLYLWNTSNIDEELIGYNGYIYQMTNNETGSIDRGKVILGKTEDGVDEDLADIINKLNIIQMRLC